MRLGRFDRRFQAQKRTAPGGIGETSTPAIAPALANAVFKATGRPVDVLEAPDGSLLVSDDHANMIYRITYER